MRTRPNKALLRNTINSSTTITSPTAYWKFDESTGGYPAVDQVTSPSSNLLSTFGTVIGVTGKINNGASVAFGSNALQNVSAPAKMTTSGTFSGCGWVKLDNSSGGYLMKLGNTTSTGWDLSISSTLIILTTYQTGPTFTNLSDSVSISTGVWYFIAWYYDSSTLGISLNGGSFTTGAGSAPGSATATYLLNNSSHTNSLQGTGDEVSYWVGHKLTSAEVTLLYNSGNGKTFNGTSWV